MPEIILTTLNAKHIHASLGLRYLYANMGELQNRTEVQEFSLESWPIDIAEQLLATKPRIIGLGVYIWNAERSQQLVAILKTISPETLIIIGGPEVSHEWQDQAIFHQADYLVAGQGDLAFAQLCQQLLKGEQPINKVVHAPAPALDTLELPYDYYSEADIKHRLVYVEASRGCPFKCEFCLSALDKTALPFPEKPFMAALEKLYLRGVRHFKFVDRTFNLNPKKSAEILNFFLDRMDDQLFLHFEVIPDHLPQTLKEILPRFPAGSLQLEIGIQSFNPEVQATISRKQDNEKSRQNLHWLRQETHAHLHADLIIGLPGEDLASFAQSFNELAALAPHEIQVGVLKRLKGSPIIRHNDKFQMRYNPAPPYNILSNSLLNFQTIQRLNRFTRYWEMIANSGRFPHTLPLILGVQPFEHFIQLSDWLYETTHQVHKIALKRLFELLFSGLTEGLKLDTTQVVSELTLDYDISGIKGRPAFLQPVKQSATARLTEKNSRKARQARHH